MSKTFNSMLEDITMAKVGKKVKHQGRRKMGSRKRKIRSAKFKRRKR